MPLYATEKPTQAKTRGAVSRRIRWIKNPSGEWIGYEFWAAEISFKGRMYASSYSLDRYGPRKARKLAEEDLERFRNSVRKGRPPYRMHSRRGPKPLKE